MQRQTTVAKQLKYHIKTLAFPGCNALWRLTHLGQISQYSIIPGYRHRDEPVYFNDTGNADEHQREVYLYAKKVMEDERLKSVYDVGCGSGFKLISYLGSYETLGFDVPDTVEFLRKKYPDRFWQTSDFSARGIKPPDLVICADVIEHVQNPDQLVDFIRGLNPTFLVLSTPDRGILYHPFKPGLFGPPRNPAHLREWSFAELRKYLSKSFRVIEHLVSDRTASTQLIFCAGTTRAASEWASRQQGNSFLSSRVKWTRKCGQ